MGLDSYGSTPFGQRRSQATLWPDSLRLLQVPCASILRKQNKKPSVLSKAFAGAVDEIKSEPEAPASVTCPSMDFTRWSSEE